MSRQNSPIDLQPMRAEAHLPRQRGKMNDPANTAFSTGLTSPALTRTPVRLTYSVNSESPVRR